MEGNTDHSFLVSSASNAKGSRLASPETHQIGKGVLPAQASPLCLDPGAASESGTVSPNFTREFLTCDLSLITLNFGRAWYLGKSMLNLAVSQSPYK